MQVSSSGGGGLGQRQVEAKFWTKRGNSQFVGGNSPLGRGWEEFPGAYYVNATGRNTPLKISQKSKM
jgi:hypothetical protein